MKDNPLLTAPDGTHDLPKGKLATRVTYLEMLARPDLRDGPCPDGLTLTPYEAPDVAWYLALFKRVGAEYLWFGRLEMAASDLAAILHPENVELAYFGVAQELVGTTAARYLMNTAISKVFDRGAPRFFVHTCDLDSPRALAFYQRSGFTPYKRALEIMDDPRLLGLLPKTSAPQVPIL